MSDRNDNDFFGKLANNDGVGKPLQHKSFRSSRRCCTGHVCQRNDFVRQKVESRIKRLGELCTQSWTPVIVPRCRFDRFFGGLFEDADASHYGLPRRARKRCRNSSRSNSFAVPPST